MLQLQRICEAIANFRVVRQLGRGGMGEVCDLPCNVRLEGDRGWLRATLERPSFQRACYGAGGVMRYILMIAFVAAACGSRPKTPPEAAVACLTEAIAAHAEFTEDDLYAAMAKAGIPGPDADRAFKFTQIAWGREFLRGRGDFQFAPDYLLFNGAGDVIESGTLSNQPYFVAAMAAVKKYASSPGFSRLALMSADVQAINKALEAGSKPTDLAMAPPALFMEPATPAGIEKAQRLLTDRVTPAAKP
jgi:hypothetical protein